MRFAAITPKLSPALNHKPLHCKATSTAADPARQPRKQNVPGTFYVDHTCIDCDLCRWISPKVFTRQEGMSAVTKQPESKQERVASFQALLSCPTHSIHCEKVEAGELREIQSTFPMSIRDGVYFNGFADEATFGASSYLVVTSKGNIMMDCPRFNPVLVKGFEEMGGVDYIVLSHIDDVGDHVKWAEKFGAIRIVHKEEVRGRLREAERKLEGVGPWSVWDDDDFGEIEIIHTPGHTLGSISLLHKPSKSMFTGDHFGYSTRQGGMSIFPRYNRGGYDLQLESVRKLLDYDFVNIYPGHGRRIEFESREEKDKAIKSFLETEASA